MVSKDFVENVLEAFRNIIREIEKGSSELEIRRTFDELFLRGVLGYERKDIKWEKKRADLTIVDENDFAIIKIETKRPEEDIDRKEYEEQAFKYKEETTKYIGLTNFLRFKLWEIQREGKKLMVDLDFSKMLEQKKSAKELSSEEKSQILFLSNLSKEIIFDPRKYQKFNETYARIDITKESGFRKLLDRLNFIVNVLLLGYTLRAFGEYKQGYSKYKEEIEKIEKLPKNEKNGYLIAKHRQKIEEEYGKYKTFGGFYLWKSYSGKENLSDDEVKEIFCKESIYILLNKLLFLRICEDKGFLEKNISNGGIEELREILKKRFGAEAPTKELLNLAFEGAKRFYSHFYETGILDWFRSGDGELDDILNRVLWILNQFDFTHVDRDILGNLYEKYLPSDERKRLGEFYTPVDVIDYILTSVGYTYSNEIEDKDLLDPACGSGGFLVRAARRLISRFLMKFGKADKKELRDPKNWKEIVGRLSPDEAKIILEAVQEHIYGFDINPFACHIAEMNLLFQVIDLYQKVKEKYPDYKLKRFKIYQTDSLELPRQKTIIDFSNNLKFLKEQEEIDAIKNKKFDFVVENPPYVRKERITEEEKKNLSKTYQEIYHGDNDYYVYFLYRSIQWLNERGKLGLIVSSKFTKTRYGKYIRAFILENMHISKFVDLRGSKIFANVTVDPCILILDKEKSDEIRVVKVKKDFEGNTWEESLRQLIWHIFRNGTKDYQDEYINSFVVYQRNLKSKIQQEDSRKVCEEWRFVNKKELKLLEKIKSISTCTLSDISEINCGIKTGRDDVFIVKLDTINKFKLEKNLLVPILDGKDIRKYKISYKNTYLIFTEGIDISNFPNTKMYLEQFKQELEKRSDIKKTNKKWYELRPCSYYDFLRSEKIITPDISMNNNFAYDDGKFFVKNTAYFIKINKPDINTKYVLGLLNSTLLEFYFKHISVYLGRSGYRYTKQHLEKLPIKLPETQEEKKIAEQIIKKVDEILELHKSRIIDIDAVLGSEETEKLYSLPKVTFSISDDARFENIKVEGSKIFINSQDFIEIKDKKIRDFVEVYLNCNKEKFIKAKDVKNLILNIPVPNSDEVLKDIIEKCKVDQSEIIEKIKNLEDEINELVYQIYGITKEEKEIIESNL